MKRPDVRTRREPTVPVGGQPALSAAISACPCPAAFVDAEFTVLVANDALADILGIALENVIGQPVTRWLTNESDHLRLRHDRAAATRQAPVVRHDVLIACAGSLPLRKTLSQRVVFDADDQIAGHVLTIDPDHSDGIQDGNLRELLAGLSHDFRNVLTVISGNLAAAMDHSDLEMARHRVTKALHGCRYAVGLTEAIQTLTRAPALRIETIDVDDFLRYFSLGLGARDSLSIKVGPKAKGASLFIAGDRQAITRILNNLIQNAVDAGATTVTIHTAAVKTATGGASVDVTVANNGATVPAALRTRIFTPYFSTKGHQATGDLAVHRGLGLAIAAHLMAGMGGTITLDPAEQSGQTCFRLSWPSANPVKRPRSQRAR